MQHQPIPSTSYSFNSSVTPSSLAPQHTLPPTHFYSVEYPGYVLQSSIPQAIRNLGGPSALETAFKRGASKADALVELQLRTGSFFAHPVPGEVVTTNSILLKVVRRKKKKATSNEDATLGEYRAEAVGVLSKTVRFRSMADYQYEPNSDDPLSLLRCSMEKMDVEAISSYRIPAEKEDYTIPTDASLAPVDAEFAMNLDPQLMSEQERSAVRQVPQGTRSNIRLFPPPIFSRQAISQNYNFKGNPASMVSIIVDEETGEERKRLINRMRWKGYGPATISFADTAVPDRPPPNVEEVREQVDRDILKRLEELFTERPIWTRMSLFNQVPPAVSREIHNSKIILPLVCYVFQDGPWRDTLVRFAYDPRRDPNARFYQRLYFRNANHPINRPSVIIRRQERAVANSFELDKDEPRTSHIFDGSTLTKETAAFQLCDITDPMLKEMIESADDVRETCDERDGWYSTQSFERIKAILRLKFFSLLDGRPATEEECRAVLEESDNAPNKVLTASRTTKLRVGKHNMAKGALRPEEAAAFRLRATLDREKKATTR